MARRPVQQPEEFVDAIVTRPCVYKGQTATLGDTIRVPVRNFHEGVGPLRWWQDGRKAAADEAEAAQFLGELVAEGVLRADRMPDLPGVLELFGVGLGEPADEPEALAE